MSLTVLTIDDSRTMRDLLKAALLDAGFIVIQAEDGLHGLEVLQAQDRTHDAVRADLARRGIPILVLTTESDAEKKARARAAGATGWIVKPFQADKLVDAVRRVAA